MKSSFACVIGSFMIVHGPARADVLPPPVEIPVVNAGFEDATASPWTLYGPTAEVTSDGPASGAKSLRLGIATTGEKEAGAYQDIHATGTGPARVSAAIAVDEEMLGDVLVELKLEAYAESDGRFVDLAQDAVLVGPHAKGVYATYHACVDLAAIDDLVLRPVALIRTPSSGSGAVRVDDFRIVLGSEAVCPTEATGGKDEGCLAGGTLGAVWVFAALALFLARHAGYVRRMRERRRAARPAR